MLSVDTTITVVIFILRMFKNGEVLELLINMLLTADFNEIILHKNTVQMVFYLEMVTALL